MATIQQLVGKWRLVDSKGFEDYMKELGEAPRSVAPATWPPVALLSLGYNGVLGSGACAAVMPGSLRPVPSLHRPCTIGSRVQCSEHAAVAGRAERARLPPRDGMFCLVVQPHSPLERAAPRFASALKRAYPRPAPSRSSSHPTHSPCPPGHVLCY